MLHMKDYELGIEAVLIHQLFEAKVAQLPDAIAVDFEGKQLTYQDLNCRANQLAYHLQALGVGPNVLVGICVERSLEMIVALLGILKAGGAYVPLDPTYPAERLTFMLENAQASILLTQSHLVGNWQKHATSVILDTDWQANTYGSALQYACPSKVNPNSSVTLDDLAYVIYTSGSTGKPKGVAMPHRPLVNLIAWQLENSMVAAGGNTLQFTPISFDVSFQEIFATLAAGGTLVLISDETRRDAVSLLRFLNDAAIARLFLPFVALQHLAQVAETEGVALASLREVITAGEQLRITPSISNWFSQLQNCTLHNHYGPSESHVVTAFTLTGSPKEWSLLPPIGRSISNAQIYLLDEQLQPVAVGVAGELYIGGISLARGYLNRPDLTEERFISNPFSPSGRLYKTGDLARYLPDGNIEYLGRMDQQVKIRGFRIEPGEIEAVLEQHPQVREAVVIDREDVPGDKRLVAYVVASGKNDSHSRELRQFLQAQLPEYMVPTAVVLLDTLPLTPTGKVDRRALPAPSRRPDMEKLTAPRTSTEAVLAGIWADILRLEQVGIHDHFLELGGHSLLATQVVSRIRDIFQVELPMRCLFESPTVSTLAKHLETAQQEARSQQTPSIQPLARDAKKPLSFMQEHLWFLDQLVPNNPFYNVPEVFRLNGLLNVTALQQGLQEIVKRHEALRTTFTIVDGKPVQVIHPSPSFKLSVVDLHELPTVGRETEAWQLIAKEAQLPFNLSQGPLLLCTLFKLSEAEHILLLNLHHIICDDWSISVLLQELATLYTAFCSGHSSPLPALTIQYADFAVWQRQWLLLDIRESQLSYWKQQLGGNIPVLQLPTDYSRPLVRTYRGARQFLTITEPLTEKLKNLSRSEGVTLFMTLLAAFQTLLFHYTRQEDIVVGSPIANRHRSEIEGVFGFFLNTLVLRTDLSSSPSFRELLVRVREVALGAYAHQDLPFEQLVQALQPDRNLNQNPLFQVLFDLQNAPMPAWKVSDLTLTRLPIDNRTAKFDLFLELAETKTGITGFFEYSTDLFEAATIARMSGHFQTLLEGIVTNPDQKISDLSLLSATEQQQLVAWNDTQIDYPQVQCIHQLFEATAERTPETVAVVFADQQLTYRELNHRANQLAHHLQALGVKPDVPVALCVERSLATVIGLLGILKAGGAYVPLDPAYPQERLAFMLEDSQVPVVLTQQNLIGVLPDHRAHMVCIDTDWDTIALGSEENPNSGVRFENLAYTIYTSGSTGKPKGVQIEHRAVVNFLNSMRQEPGLTETDVFLAVTTISFDIAALEIYLPLMVGARIVLVSREVASDAARLSLTLEQSGATVMQATPATWRLLLSAGWQGNKQLKILCGGEALTRQLANQLQELSNSLWNMYGPTETTIWSAIHKVEPKNSPVPIGRPIANTQFYIIDQHLRPKEDPLKPVPIGVPGELYIGGFGLARGYLNRPELTDEKFIPNPFSNEPGARLYKTGDLGRLLSDGNIEIIGRIDHQVKIRGFRIELGEIEAAISQNPAVRETVVIAREDKSLDKRLVAYVVPQPQLPESEQQHTVQASDAEPTKQWQKIWNETYSQSEAGQDATFNISGWNNSYTGVLTPAAELREWLDHTVYRILSLQPNRVLEIGCGLGLLLFRIAPKCEHYFGTDISAEAVDYIEQNLNSKEQKWSQVKLATRAADAIDEVETEAFDTVVINSVIQYFPSIDYLVRVLERAVKAVKPGGRIFVGDVRSLPLLEAFHTSVQRYQAPDSLTKAQLHKRVQERMTQDKELVIDPAFFTAIAQHLPQISHVQIQLKRGSHHNELTRFRYDVILHVGTEVYPTVEPLWLDWQQQELTLPAIRQLLKETEPEILGISRVLNARVLADTKAVELLASDNGPQTAGDLRKTLEKTTHGVGIDPEDLTNLSQDLPYTIHINWSGSGADGCYDVVFQRRSTVSPDDTNQFPPAPLPLCPSAFNLKPWSSYANDPLHVKHTTNLVPQLRAFLKDNLPDYMVPAAFVVMDTLPLMLNGKIDRRALPEPNQARPDLKEVFVAPRTPVEERLAQIWDQVLGIEQVGIHDNFFELGGHSLLTIQMLSGVQKTFRVELPLISLFKAPTVAGLAHMIADQQAEDSAQSTLNPVLNLNAEAVLDPAINPLVASIKVVGEKNIFLTGATGFLGAFLLHELLEKTQATIYCLVKATYPTEARARLQGSLENYSLWNQSKSSRIIPVVGDLALPLLGLSSEQFQTLTETIDVIYHNGGLVNFIYPYSVLKAANVLGTQEVLRLASETKIKSVHFVSTIGVFSPVAYPDVQVIQEQEASRTEGLYGYTQSKWVAEKLIAKAHSRGLSTSIYRPTWIEGHSQTGVANRPGFLRSLIKGCIQLGLAPDWNMQVDIVPVDYTASAIIHLSRRISSSGKAFHVSNPQSISWNQLVNWMRAFGYPLQHVPYSKWIAEVMRLVQKTPENALYPFLTFLSEKIEQQQMTVPEIYFQAKSSLRFDCQNTLDGLAGTAISCPPVDDKLLTTYFSYFIRTGFLEPPQIHSGSVFKSLSLIQARA